MTREDVPKMKSSLWPKTLTGLLASLAVLSASGVASATWTNRSLAGSGASGATTLSAPGSPTITKGTCNGGKNHYNATFAFAGSTSGFASSTYTVLYGTTNGGPYATTAGTGTSPITTTGTPFGNNTTYYVVVQAKAGSGWVASSSQATMSFSC